jgi:hypothetical protein
MTVEIVWHLRTRSSSDVIVHLRSYASGSTWIDSTWGTPDS